MTVLWSNCLSLTGVVPPQWFVAVSVLDYDSVPNVKCFQLPCVVVKFLSAGDVALSHHHLPLSQEFSQSCVKLELAGLD